MEVDLDHWQEAGSWATSAMYRMEALCGDGGHGFISYYIDIMRTPVTW